MNPNLPRCSPAYDAVYIASQQDQIAAVQQLVCSEPIRKQEPEPDPARWAAFSGKIPMASRSSLLMSALASAVKLHPRLSAGLAFELGVMAGAYIKEARGRRGLAGATAKLIDAVPVIPHAPPARRAKKRKVAAKKPKAKRAKVAARVG